MSHYLAIYLRLTIKKSNKEAVKKAASKEKVDYTRAFFFLDTHYKWSPGTAAELTYTQFNEYMNIISCESPVKYLIDTPQKKQDDSERLNKLWREAQARGENPSLAALCVRAQRSRR